MDDPRELAHCVDAALAGAPGVDAAELRTRLSRARGALLELLKTQPPNPDARAAVQSLHPQTPIGRVRLDAGDVQQVVLLSDELRIDEISALLCLVTAHDERGDAAADVAAGVFFDARRAAVAALHSLLASQALGGDAPTPPDVAAVVGAAVRDLVTATNADGAPTLVTRLVAAIADTTLDPEPGAALARVVDERGAECDRRAVVAAERASLCECLALALRCGGAPPPPPTAAALVDLAHALALRARGPDPAAAAAAWPHAYTVTLATAAALVPRCGAAGRACGADAKARLAALAADPGLASRLDPAPPAEDALAPLLRAAWGALLSLAGAPDASTARAADAVATAVARGAVGALASLLSSPALADDPPSARRVCAAAAYDVVAALLDSDAGRDAVGDLASASADASAAAAAAGTASAPASTAQPAPSFALVPSSGAAPPGHPPPPGRARDPPTPDTLASLLAALAAVLDVAPELWLDDALRADVVGEFLEYVGAHPVLAEAPAALVAYTDVLAAIAAGGPDGAAAVLNQLCSGHAPGAVSWAAGLGAMAEYCARYAGPAAAAAAAAAGASGDGLLYGLPPPAPSAAPPPPPPDLAVPDSDAAGMAAYARLAAAVLRRAPRGGAAAWRAALEAEAGGAPLAELALQLMCHPVPSPLKAALDDLLAALAAEPGAAAPLLDRLAGCLLSDAGGAGGADAGGGGAFAGGAHPSSRALVARHDAAYQLAEVEARREEYGETLALVRLLTACVRRAAAAGGGGGLPDDGAPYAAVATFVRRDVLAAALSRGFRSPAQRWHLAAAAFDHVAAWLAAAARGGGGGGGRPFASVGAATAAASRPGAPTAPPTLPPALDAVLDLLSEGPASRAVLAVLLPGADALAAEPRADGRGAAREAAVRAALRLLRLASSLDGAALDAVRAAGVKGAYEPLAAALARDVRAVPALLDYARYAPCPPLQAEALRLAVALAPRLPAAVDGLLQAGAGGGGPSPAARVRDGVAACLTAGLFGARDDVDWGSDDDGDVDDDEEDEDEAGGDGRPGRPPPSDPRAALALELLRAGAAAPPSAGGPTLTHLLLGYDVSRGDSGLASSVLDARYGGAAAAPLVRAALAPGALDADTDAAVLSVLAAVAASPSAGGPMRALLRGARVVPLRLADEAATVRGGGAGRPRAAALLLSLAAEDALRADPADPAAVAGVADVADALLDRGDGGGGGELAACVLLGAATSARGGGGAPPPPALFGGARPSPDVAAAAAALGLDAILASPTVRLAPPAPGAAPGFDVRALAAALRRALDGAADAARRGGPPPPPSPAASAACRAALEFAASANEWADAAAARGDAATAWAAAVALLFARRFDVVASRPSSGGADGAAALALELARAAAAAVAAALPADPARVAAPLARAVAALTARAREVAARALGAPGDPPPAVRAPSVLHATLKGVLAALAAARGATAPRAALHTSLLELLGLASPRAAAAAPPALLAALRAAAGGEGGGALPASADGDALDARVAAALAASPAAIDGAAADALDAGGAGGAPARVVALALLAGAAALPPGDLAARVRAGGLPARLAGALAAAPPTALVAAPLALGGGGASAGPLAGRAAALEAEAALALLARCAASPGGGGGGAAAAAAELAALARCAALDLEPEEPTAAGAAAAGRGGGGARAALARVLPAALRLASLRLAAHAASPDVVEGAASFVRAHRRALARVLADAVSPGARGWTPGPPELTQAALVLGLLARLTSADAHLGDAGVELRDAATRLAARFFAVDARGAVPAAARLAAARDAGVSADDRDDLDALATAVRRVRLAAAAYVLALVRGGGGGGGGDGGGGRGGRFAAPASAPPPRPLILRAAPLPGGGAARLSLVSVKDALFQAAEDLYAASDARRSALAALAAAAAAPASSSPAAAPDRAAALAAATSADAAARGTLRLAETCLAIVWWTLRAHRDACGSAADRAQLGRVLAPALDHLARLPGDDGVGGEGRAAALAALARRVEAEVGE